MINLHENLSEFSYGYGVTRETESYLASIGVRSVPYLPNLIDEAGVGFDVKFNKPGAALLLQFKLGQWLTRFVRSDTTKSRPAIDKHFWRFRVDTAEPNGQFEILLRAEQDGAETYYVAPRFHDWNDYLSIYLNGAVLESSLLIAPSEIRSQLVANGEPDGRHRIVYDRDVAFVCSDPIEVREVTAATMAEKAKASIAAREVSLGQTVQKVYSGFEHRASVRREARTGSLAADAQRTPDQEQKDRRAQRLEAIRSRTKSDDEAVAIAIGAECWAAGIQLFLLEIPD